MRIFRQPLLSLLLALLCAAPFSLAAQPTPGLEPYIPNRIEWLALLCNDQLRQDITVDSPFTLSVIQGDHETLLIYVRYQSNVNREIMNTAIDTAHTVIMIMAKSYGWDKWVKIKERVEMVRPKSTGTRN